MRKIIILLALALLNLNVSATENSGFFSKYFLKEGLTQTESNVVLNGGPIWNIVPIMKYLDKKETEIYFMPALTVGYEKKYSDDSRLLFNITASSGLKLKKENWKLYEYLKVFAIRGDLLWTRNIFRTESFYIDYGFGLNVDVVLQRDSDKIKFAGYIGSIIPIYLSFNWQITDNVTGMAAVIPVPFAVGIILDENFDIQPFTINDSVEIGVKIKM